MHCCAGRLEKTLPIINKDLNDAGISAEILTEDSEIIKGKVYLRTGCLSGGFDYPDIGCAAITQMKAMSAKKRKSRHKAGEEIKKPFGYTDRRSCCSRYVRHRQIFRNKNIETNGVTKDYITIKYAGTDVLYVPVTQLDLVSRYIGPRDDGAVKLNKLNSMEWTKTRNKVKSAVKDMAEELTKLYAQRQMAKGFAFSLTTIGRRILRSVSTIRKPTTS